MPEGPEVKTMAIWLANYLDGKTITQIEQIKAKVKSFDRLRLPRKIERISVKGKKIFFHLDEFILMSSVLMTGRWSLEQDQHTRLIFSLDDGSKLYYVDQRNFGQHNVLTTAEYEAQRKKLGLDFLNENPTEKEFFQCIRSPRRKKARLAEALMKQEWIAGIGNYLRAEIIYQAKLNPWLEIGQLTDAEIIRLYQAIQEIMLASFQAGGLTIANYFTPEGKKGRFQAKIYQQEETPSGKPILQMKDKNNRRLYYVEPE